MTQFAGLDVSVRETAVCVVDDAGKVLAERKVASEPDDLIQLLRSIGGEYGRIGLEAGPLSQWLVNGLAEAGLPVVCVETRHMKALLKAQTVNKSDRNDAREVVLAESLGHAGGAAARHAPGHRRGGASSGGRSAPHVGRWDRLPLEQQSRLRGPDRMISPA